MQTVRAAVSIVAAAAVLAGCAPVGPRAIRQERFHYNQAVARTIDEQMLLNLVRLRYRDTPYFLEVANVSTQYELSRSASAGGLAGEVDDEFQLGAGIAYSERPTVVYQPLAGADFARRLLAPMSPESLFLLTGAGWRVERVLRCGVARLNQVWNAPTASGPTPAAPPRYAEFLETARALQALQDELALDLDYLEGSRSLILRFAPGADRGDVDRLLGLDPGTSEFRIAFRGSGSADLLAVETRSLMGVMYFLSQAVEVPERDRAGGRVTTTRDAAGAVFEWTEVLDGLLRVRTSDDEPDDAFVRVRYRDAWFYIDDADLDSKSTFNLLGQLFSLQAGEVRGEAPVLTLPLGN